MAVSAISPEINRTAQTLAQPVDRGSGKKAAVKKDEPRQQEAPAPVAVNSEAAANAVADDIGVNKWWKEPELVTNARTKGIL